MNQIDKARSRLSQTFKFLKELNEVRNPVHRDLSYTDVHRLNKWPDHPCIQIIRTEIDPKVSDVSTEEKSEPLIRIQRAGLTVCPPPPQILEGWLKPGWQGIDGKVEVI